MEAQRDDQGDLASMLEADDGPRQRTIPQSQPPGPLSSTPAQATGKRNSIPAPQPRPQPAPAAPPQKTGGNAALYVVIALVVLAGAGAAAWFGGFIPH